MNENTPEHINRTAAAAAAAFKRFETIHYSTSIHGDIVGMRFIYCFFVAFDTICRLFSSLVRMLSYDDVCVCVCLCVARARVRLRAIASMRLQFLFNFCVQTRTARRLCECRVA